MATRGTGSLGPGGEGVSARRGVVALEESCHKPSDRPADSLLRPTRKLRPKRERLCRRSRDTGLAHAAPAGGDPRARWGPRRGGSTSKSPPCPEAGELQGLSAPPQPLLAQAPGWAAVTGRPDRAGGES